MSGNGFIFDVIDIYWFPLVSIRVTIYPPQVLSDLMAAGQSLDEKALPTHLNKYQFLGAI